MAKSKVHKKSHRRDVPTVSMQPGELRTAAKRGGTSVAAVVMAKEELLKEGKKRHTRAEVISRAQKHYGILAKLAHGVEKAAGVFTGNPPEHKPGATVYIGKSKQKQKVAKVEESKNGYEYRLEGKKNAYLKEQIHS